MHVSKRDDPLYLRDAAEIEKMQVAWYLAYNIVVLAMAIWWPEWVILPAIMTIVFYLLCWIKIRALARQHKVEKFELSKINSGWRFWVIYCTILIAIAARLYASGVPVTGVVLTFFLQMMVIIIAFIMHRIVPYIVKNLARKANRARFSVITV